MRAALRRWGRSLIGAVVAVGAAVTVLVAWDGRLPVTDAATLVGLAAGAAAISGVVAATLLRRRRSSIRFQALVASLTPVLAVAIGVAAAASAMFISPHDLHALFVVLAAAGTVGLTSALLLGRRATRAGQSLELLARRLGDDGPGSGRLEALAGWARTASPAEFASLATELELTSVRLAEAQQQARALEASRRELVAWVSHDLRTPLAGIRAMVEALEDGVVEDEVTVARYHATIRREADRLTELVNDLFELSKIHAGALVLDLEPVALDELVSDVLATATFAAAAKGVALQATVANPSPVVDLSTPEMNRVLTNLVDNAVRHTPPGGTVQLDVTFDDVAGAGLVAVSDGCGGIPEDELGLVFEVAYRGDTARTPGSGAGLGLAVARGLVEAHGGTIGVTNEGGGCRFVVGLPLAGQQQQADTAGRPETAGAADTAGRIPSGRAPRSG